jgi:hypothetical protein
MTIDSRALIRYTNDLITMVNLLLEYLISSDCSQQQQPEQQPEQQQSTHNTADEQVCEVPIYYDTTLHFRAIHYYLRNLLRQASSLHVC